MLTWRVAAWLGITPEAVRLLAGILVWCVAVALVLIALNVVVAAKPQRWLQLGCAWLVTATTIGVVCATSLLTIVWDVVDYRDWTSSTGVSGVFAQALVLSSWAGATALALFALPYLPLLLAWARLGVLLGRLESTYGGACLSCILLALPGLVWTRIFAENAALLSFSWQALLTLLLIALSLLIPRLLFPVLRPCAFAHGADSPCVDMATRAAPLNGNGMPLVKTTPRSGM